MAKLPIGLQMYTLRNELTHDFEGVFTRVAEIGYAGVEIAGMAEMPAITVKNLLDDLGLQIAGTHVSLLDLEFKLEAALDYNQELGNSRVVCPYLPEDRRSSADDYRKLAEFLNSVGQVCKDRGMVFGYHNHAFEFEKYDGEYAYDILFGAADSNLVKAEIDTYWVQKGGADPIEYINKYAGRVPLLHIKDMTDDDEQTFAEIGEGTLNWPGIFAAAETTGVEWYIVEQDLCRRPPLESVAISFANLKKMGKV